MKKRPEPKKRTWADLSQEEREDLLRKASGDVRQKRILNILKKQTAGKVLSDREVELVEEHLNPTPKTSLEGIETAEVTVNELALFLGLTDRRIQQLSNEGVIQKARHGKYRLVESIHDYVHYLQSKVLRATKDPEVNDERARKMNLEAELLDLQLRKKRGELVEFEEIEKVWDKILVTVRNRLLTIPTKLPPYVLGLTDLASIKKMVEKFIYEAMLEIAETDPDTIIEERRESAEDERDDSEDLPDVEASSEDEGLEVGRFLQDAFS